MLKVALMELLKELIQIREEQLHKGVWLVYKKCQKRRLYEDLNRQRTEKRFLIENLKYMNKFHKAT